MSCVGSNTEGEATVAVRADRVVIYGPLMNRMYSLVADEGGLYLVHTGPAVKIGFVAGGQLQQMAADAVISRGLRRIVAAEQALTEQGPARALRDSGHSRFVPYDEIIEVDFREKGSLFVGRRPTLRLVTRTGKLKLVFRYSTIQDAQPIVQAVADRCPAGVA